ncbi:hypothetical protein FGO68_gene10887 [Halteria grandinella]|uniref:Uncharacterized protein n=1 Tax=Halteria grandinella TaxID=5974 RepID=A0A8J8SVH9_HALGN|nr:hypothetical protein FGO68_gene10887 [Halteria grandinella]
MIQIMLFTSMLLRYMGLSNASPLASFIISWTWLLVLKISMHLSFFYSSSCRSVSRLMLESGFTPRMPKSCCWGWCCCSGQQQALSQLLPLPSLDILLFESAVVLCELGPPFPFSFAQDCQCTCIFLW